VLGHSPSKNWSELSNDRALERFAVVYVKAAAQTSDKETINRKNSPVVLTKCGLKT
jgi:hypothetical protein